MIVLTEKDALKELKAGSEEALGWLIEQYGPYVSAIIHNIIGDFMDMSDVEEVASDVFVALWENRKKVYFLKGYLGTLARNMAKNKLRSMGRELSLEEDRLLIDPVSAADVVEQRELMGAVRRFVTGMEWPDREIFLRYYYYCQSQETIASEMDMNLSTVKTRLRRGRLRLKQQLTDYVT